MTAVKNKKEKKGGRSKRMKNEKKKRLRQANEWTSGCMLVRNDGKLKP